MSSQVGPPRSRCTTMERGVSIKADFISCRALALVLPSKPSSLETAHREERGPGVTDKDSFIRNNPH